MPAVVEGSAAPLSSSAARAWLGLVVLPVAGSVAAATMAAGALARAATASGTAVASSPAVYRLRGRTRPGSGDVGGPTAGARLGPGVPSRISGPGAGAWLVMMLVPDHRRDLGIGAAQ